MTNLRSRAALAAGAIAVSIALASCASVVPADDSPDPVAPVEVLGEGTVIQVGDAAPQFCLGAVAESYPPQCSGPELVGWDWETPGGFETSGDVTWGTYAVGGSWDGERLTVGSAIMLALFDPLPVPDPALDPANPGSASEDDLLAIQETISDEAPVEVLSSWIENGYLFVRVLFDEGEIQEWATDRYGANVVQVRPALRIVEP